MAADAPPPYMAGGCNSSCTKWLGANGAAALIGQIYIYIFGLSTEVAGDDIRQKLEFHHVHLEIGALGYIETFLFYWSWGVFQNNPPPWPIFVFENTRDMKTFF